MNAVINSFYARPVAAPTYINPNEPSMAKQEFKKEADINTIMSRYMKTGTLPLTPERHAQYGDFTGIDFQDVQNRIAAGVQEFERLPSDLRLRFGNSAANYFEYVANASPDELRSLGLLPPASAPVVSQTAPSAQNPTGTPSATSTAVATPVAVTASTAPAQA